MALHATWLEKRRLLSYILLQTVRSWLYLKVHVSLELLWFLLDCFSLPHSLPPLFLSLNPFLSPFSFLLSLLSPSLLPSLLPPPRNYRFPLCKVRKVHSSTFVHKLRLLYSHILCGCYKDDRTSFGMVLLQKYRYGQVILLAWRHERNVLVITSYVYIGRLG